MCDCCDYIAARGGRPDDPQLMAEYEAVWRRATRAMIEDCGCAVVHVEGPSLPWAYTIGLWPARGHPELVVFGLDRRHAHDLLNALAHSVTQHGDTLADGDVLELSDDPGDRVALFTVPNPGQVVLRANAYVGRDPAESVSALQVVYPDDLGVWPWEPGCRLARGQPMPGSFVA
ncbi:DUF4262 domain-containing protein [uncultured Jatrophihabitans sp.]|uniref:DUF4262 domain-containing protein n=1 Tax=uncultured Jatrophihabitans sp. TaxID=1610747 RepID=UPI0035CB4872